MLQPLVNLPLYHSHFLRLNFAHISKPFWHLVPTSTFFPARTDYIDLYPNNDLNHTCAPENISGHFGLLFLRASYKFQFYLLTYLIIFKCTYLFTCTLFIYMYFIYLHVLYLFTCTLFIYMYFIFISL